MVKNGDIIVQYSAEGINKFPLCFALSIECTQEVQNKLIILEVNQFRHLVLFIYDAFLLGTSASRHN